MMEEERARLIQSEALLDDGEHQKSSSVTTTLVLSTIVSASINFGYTAPTQSVIMEDLGLSLAEFSVFGSMSDLGSVLGALASGRTADMVGRKGTMWFLNLFYIVGWLAIAFAKVPVYLAEITPKNLRGRFMAGVQANF
ncbi:hypothetical protein V6N12_023800 [Hibiscus sabdariffa]|uniref:Major facilitator superfamily (MFS) profile domain-containing protein n=1 Tax=Hibiscus sabdariffa TaxID=183260 RepID=A0ABR2FZ60_9ROSI